MMRTENDSSSVAPTTRIYLQDGNSYRVAPIPVLGMTYSAGKLLKDFLDLSNAVSTGKLSKMFLLNVYTCIIFVSPDILPKIPVLQLLLFLHRGEGKDDNIFLQYSVI